MEEPKTQQSQAYDLVLEIRRKLDQPSLAFEPLAGLARIALAEGDLPSAQAYAAQIMAYLDNGGTLAGADEPQRVSLTCIKMLQVTGDPRAEAILEHAYAQLQQNASRILAEPSRRSYLDNVPWHREIIKLWQNKSNHRDAETQRRSKLTSGCRVKNLYITRNVWMANC
jgi:hypothetical protein